MNIFELITLAIILFGLAFVSTLFERFSGVPMLIWFCGLIAGLLTVVYLRRDDEAYRKPPHESRR